MRPTRGALIRAIREEAEARISGASPGLATAYFVLPRFEFQLIAI